MFFKKKKCSTSTVTIFYLCALSEWQHKMRPCLARALNSEFYFVCAFHSVCCESINVCKCECEREVCISTVSVPHATAKIYSSFASIENKLSFPAIDLLIVFSFSFSFHLVLGAGGGGGISVLLSVFFATLCLLACLPGITFWFYLLFCKH